uniref:Lipase domain-containing protein n=1 Tax=Anopheles merus TaxID=30066 RepID=A0A182UY30_ANOME
MFSCLALLQLLLLLLLLLFELQCDAMPVPDFFTSPHRSQATSARRCTFMKRCITADIAFTSCRSNGDASSARLFRTRIIWRGRGVTISSSDALISGMANVGAAAALEALECLEEAVKDKIDFAGFSWGSIATFGFIRRKAVAGLEGAGGLLLASFLGSSGAVMLLDTSSSCNRCSCVVPSTTADIGTGAAGTMLSVLFDSSLLLDTFAGMGLTVVVPAVLFDLEVLLLPIFRATTAGMIFFRRKKLLLPEAAVPGVDLFAASDIARLVLLGH